MSITGAYTWEDISSLGIPLIHGCLLLCQNRKQHLHHLRLCVCLYNLAGALVEFTRSRVAFGYYQRPDHKVVDTISDISQCQR